MDFLTSLLLTNRGRIPHRSAELYGCTVRNNAAFFLHMELAKGPFRRSIIGRSTDTQITLCFLTGPRFLAS